MAQRRALLAPRRGGPDVVESITGWTDRYGSAGLRRTGGRLVPDAGLSTLGQPFRDSVAARRRVRIRIGVRACSLLCHLARSFFRTGDTRDRVCVLPRSTQDE